MGREAGDDVVAQLDLYVERDYKKSLVSIGSEREREVFSFTGARSQFELFDFERLGLRAAQLLHRHTRCVLASNRQQIGRRRTLVMSAVRISICCSPSTSSAKSTVSCDSCNRSSFFTVAHKWRRRNKQQRRADNLLLALQDSMSMFASSIAFIHAGGVLS